MESLDTIYLPKSLAKIAYEKLRLSILNGEFHAGELYNEMALAKEMGISRTPVREALLELSSKGLVEFLPRRGIMISVLSKKDVEELFELRKVLERYFVSKVSSDPGKYDFSKLEKCIEEQKNAQNEKNIPKYLRANGEFHYILGEMCNNDRMRETYGNLVDLICLIALQGMESPLRIDHLINQHEAMLQALKNGETSMADALLTIHLKESKQAALSTIKNSKEIVESK